jgi:very-short-patch-repair endonuclease
MRNNRFETTDASTYQLLLDKAREMRKNPTEAESVLWNYLSDNKMGTHFRRQHPVYGYIPDFISLKDKLIIEVDGGYHLEGEQPEVDAERTKYLNEEGFIVLRFTNEEVLCDIDNVLEEIEGVLDTPDTHPLTPPVREGSCSYSEHSNLPSRTGGVGGGFPVGGGYLFHPFCFGYRLMGEDPCARDWFL